MSKTTTARDLYEEWTHFLSKINFKESFLDDRAIQFMNDFKKNLENTIEVKHNASGWISVNDELPKFDTIVLVHSHYEYRKYWLAYLQEAYITRTKTGNPLFKRVDGNLYEATHWMQIPEVIDE